MDHKKGLTEILNEIIDDFLKSSKVNDFAIILRDKIIRSPKSSEITDEIVKDIQDKLNIKRLETEFQKGGVQFINIELANQIIYYLKGEPEVELIVLPQKEKMEGLDKKLKSFIEQLCAISESIADLPDEEMEKINQAFSEIDILIEEFEIPKFDQFKKLVKFAAYFSKNE